MELRDGNKDRFGGKGVSKAVGNINTTINEALKGIDASDIYAVAAARTAAIETAKIAFAPRLDLSFVPSAASIAPSTA